MDFFDEAALRLKQQLKVTEDKQVAEMLGMSGNAWTMRKRRRSFPEVELYALAARRPELKINVEYVLTGRAPQPMTAHGRDDYLAGELTALKVMVQALLLTHPCAKQAQETFALQMKAIETGLTSEPLPDDFMRGLRSCVSAFRLLPIEEATSVVVQPPAEKALHGKKSA
jgi:hypothetical protein